MITSNSKVIMIIILISLSTSLFGVNSQIELDLREANVVNVVHTDLGDDEYNFDVTLYHDDDGESPNYADKWVVESKFGDLLGERILTHAHGTYEFTRSGRITIIDTPIIIIRGHDQIHEWGGTVIAFDFLTEGTQIINQGDDRLDFSNFVFEFGNEISPPTHDNTGKSNGDDELVFRFNPSGIMVLIAIPYLTRIIKNG